MVSDELAELDKPSLEPEILSRYSTVERRWVYRTQMHHFKHITFKKHASLRRWRKTFKPDPSGVSKHVRQIRWIGVRTLAGFGPHLAAFTSVGATAFPCMPAFC